MSDKEKEDSENWRKNLFSGSLPTKKEDEEDQTEEWLETCEKVLHFDQFKPEKWRPTDEAQIDVGARTYRRLSIQDDPVPAPEPPNLSSVYLEDKKKVRTEDPRDLGATGTAQKPGSRGGSRPSSPLKFSGSAPSRVHKEDSFPRIHHVMSRKLHSWGSRDDSEPVEVSAPPSPKKVPSHQKIAGAKMETITDEDLSEVPEEFSEVGTEMPSESRDESDIESDSEFLPWHIRRPSHFSDVLETDEDYMESKTGKVKFGQPGTESETEPEPSHHAIEKPPKKKKHRKRESYHSHRRKSHFTEEELRQRWVRGSELPHEDPGQFTGEDLENRDMAAMASHRMDPLTGLSIHKISKAASSFPPGMSSDAFMNLQLSEQLHEQYEIDRSRRPLFVEMDELIGNEWREQARWIKFEEDFLEGANRWGRAHISSLTFHSLINLRLVLEKCVLLLDFDAKDYHSVVYRLVEEFVINDDLTDEMKVEILRTLLLPHKYVDGHSSNFRFGHLKRSLSKGSMKGDESIKIPTHGDAKMKWLRQFSGQESSSNLDAIAAQSQALLHKDDRRGSAHIIPMGETGKKHSAVGFGGLDHHASDTDDVDMPHSQSSAELQRLALAQRKDNIMSKLEEGTEGTMTLVGALESLKKPVVGFVRLSHGVVMTNLMEVPIPVRFIFVLFTPSPSPNMDCHEVGRSFSTLMTNLKFQKVCFTIMERQDLLNSINNFLDETVVLPPGDWEKKNLLSMSEIQELKRKKRLRIAVMEKIRKEKEEKAIGLEVKRKESIKTEPEDKRPKDDDPLQRTNIPFGGVINEFKKRLPLYLTDITDSLSPMCIAATIFIFFAAISGAVAFGGLYGDKTEGLIGISETLITSAIAGCLFALFSGQPIVIIGVTGPVMVYDEALYKFAKGAEVEYLPWRVWIGLWTLVIALIVAAFQGSFVVKFFSKFTKDIFAAFIATVFIYEALLKTFGFFNAHPTIQLVEYCTKPDISAFLQNMSSVNNDFEDDNFTSIANFTKPVYPVFDVEPNTAFKSLILQFCTFWIAYYLRLFRNGKALGRTIRRALGDFGVPIAIVIMVGVDMAFPAVFSQKLNVPEGLDVTSPDKRSWFISPLGMNQPIPIWLPFISVLPAILLYLLLFMETSICELILMDKCKKGSGLHWDVVLLSLLNVPGAFFGGPWICAATVRAIAHLSSLTVMSTTHAPGESPKFVEVKDQRVTAFFVNLLVGLSVLLSPLLKLVPNAVIFGVFLYMGISSLGGIQFFDRFWLFFMPVKHHPNISYVRRVRTRKMHLYTICQGIGLAILWIVKSTPAALVFPFFVVFMIPLRLSLKFLFTPRELDALDGPNAGTFVVDDEDEPDFYIQGIGG